MIGCYNPHYHFIMKSSPKWKISSATQKNISGYKKLISNTTIEPNDIPRCNIGCVKFKTQSKRKPIYETERPLDSRFEPFNDSPEISSKYKRIQQISLSKTVSRPAKIFNTTSTNLMYFPKYLSVDPSKSINKIRWTINEI